MFFYHLPSNNNINGILFINGVDILDYLKTNHIGMKSRVIRGFDCLSSPANNDNNDFIYYVDAINDTLFTSVIAIDVRTNQIYKNNMIGGNWIGWDKFILNSDLSNFVKCKNISIGSVELIGNSINNIYNLSDAGLNNILSATFGNINSTNPKSGLTIALRDGKVVIYATENTTLSYCFINIFYL